MERLTVIRIKSTGRLYACPKRYSDLPPFSIAEGDKPKQTSFNVAELRYMVECGSAEVIGTATITVNVEINE